MKEFWNSLLTEKSWEVLKEIREKYNFILIGGWAVYLLTKQNKSKDIDIVVGINELEKLKNEGIAKNDSLKKYEIKKGEIDIDVYVDYYSKLAIPVKDIKKYTLMIDGFKIAKPELMLLLKEAAFLDRRDSIKGEKDKIDILSLVFFSGFDLNEFARIAKEYSLEPMINELKSIVYNFRDFSALNMNPQELKKSKNEFILKWKKLK